MRIYMNVYECVYLHTDLCNCVYVPFVYVTVNVCVFLCA